MKVLVSYVVQDEKEHRHQSEIIEIIRPAFTISADIPMLDVIKWADQKQSELLNGQKIIVLNTFNI